MSGCAVEKDDAWRPAPADRRDAIEILVWIGSNKIWPMFPRLVSHSSDYAPAYASSGVLRRSPRQSTDFVEGVVRRRDCPGGC